MGQGAAARRRETLDYMQTLLRQMRVMAERERCGMLAYYIEMAVLEVGDLLKAESASVERIKQ